MSRYPIFYCSPASVDAGFMPVEAADAYEAEQIVQREHPGAVTASLSERVTNAEEIRRLFLACSKKSEHLEPPRGAWDAIRCR